MKNTPKLLALFLVSMGCAMAQVAWDTQVYAQDGSNNQAFYYQNHSATSDQFEMWDATTHLKVAAAFSGSDFLFDGANLSLGLQRVRVQTNTSGVATWTFPVAFTANPIVTVTVEDAASGVTWNHKVTAMSTTSVTVQLAKNIVVTVLGVNVIGVSATPQAYIHITAIAP